MDPARPAGLAMAPTPGHCSFRGGRAPGTLAADKALVRKTALQTALAADFRKNFLPQGETRQTGGHCSCLHWHQSTGQAQVARVSPAGICSSQPAQGLATHPGLQKLHRTAA